MSALKMLHIEKEISKKDMAIQSLSKLIVELCMEIDDFDCNERSYRQTLQESEFHKKEIEIEKSYANLRRIGEILNDNGGFELMVCVSNIVVSLDKNARRPINEYWHCIGKWAM